MCGTATLSVSLGWLGATLLQHVCVCGGFRVCMGCVGVVWGVVYLHIGFSAAALVWQRRVCCTGTLCVVSLEWVLCTLGAVDMHTCWCGAVPCNGDHMPRQGSAPVYPTVEHLLVVVPVSVHFCAAAGRAVVAVPPHS